MQHLGECLHLVARSFHGLKQIIEIFIISYLHRFQVSLLRALWSCGADMANLLPSCHFPFNQRVNDGKNVDRIIIVLPVFFMMTCLSVLPLWTWAIVLQTRRRSQAQVQHGTSPIHAQRPKTHRVGEKVNQKIPENASLEFDFGA